MARASGRKVTWLVAVLILLTAGFIFWQNFKYHFVNKKIDNLISGKSGGLYQLNYHHLIIDEVAGNISVENVDLLPDSLVYDAMQKDNREPDNLFYIRIPALQITGVKTPKTLLNKEISAHIIRIQNADIELRLSKGKKGKKTDFSKYLDGSAYRMLLGKLNAIRADSIILENARLLISDIDSKVIRLKITGLSIRFAGTSIDSSWKNDKGRILFSQELDIHCDQSAVPLGKQYDLMVSGLHYSSQQSSFHTGQVRLKCKLNETAFAASNKYAKDRIDLDLGSLDIININRDSILREALIADTVIMNEASLHIFRDKSYPHDSVDRTQDFPQEAIMLLSVPIYVKTIRIRNSYIEYKEKNDKSDSSGKVAFHHVNAHIDNVTNILQQIRKQPQMILYFDASFLNTASFNAKINMRLNDSKGSFTLDARLAAMNAADLNQLLRPMALAEAKSGKITELRYHLNATNTYGKGELVFNYEDLSLKLLKKDDDENKYKTKTLPTLAVGLLMKHSNPQEGKTRIGNVDFTRDIHRSIFNLMWKSMLSGIKQIAL